MEVGAGRRALCDAFEADVRVQAIGPDEDLLGLLGHIGPDILLFASPTGGNLGLLRTVRSAHPKLPLLVLALGSTLASQGFLEKLGELAVTRFLELPIEPEEFCTRVREFLRRQPETARPARSFKRFFKAGEVVFLENDAGRECFIVNAGRVRIAKALNRYTLHPLTEIGPGEIFGEMALLSSGRRSATAIASEDTVATVLTQQNFGDVMADSPAFALELLDIFVRRHTEARRRLDPSVTESSDDGWFHEEASHFSGRAGPKPELPRQEFEAGEVVLLPGSPVKTLYFVLEGQVQVESPALGAFSPAPSSAVGADSPLGEVAFLTGEPLDISAVAVEKTVVVAIPRERFVAAVASRPAVCLKLVQSIAGRVRGFNEALGVREVLELA